MEIIYKSNQNAKRTSLGLRDRVEFKVRTRASAFNWEWSREVVIEANINNRSKSLLFSAFVIIIGYRVIGNSSATAYTILFFMSCLAVGATLSELKK